MHSKSTCREYRVIPIAELPKVYDENNVERVATDQELMQLGIHIFDRGTNKVQAICVGYWDRENKIGVDSSGTPWPGIYLTGTHGMYRNERLDKIKLSMETYKNGINGGRTRLLLNKRPEENIRTGIDGQTITPVVLSEIERLKRNIPKIMGD